MSVLRMPVLAALILIFAGCSTRHAPLAVEPSAPPAVAYTPAPPAISPINSNLSPAATLWHFRVALNVAALACRGPDEGIIIANYNGLLAEQRASLAAAQTGLSSEYRARGGDWQDNYDDSMTRLYNFFSQSQARTRFCAAAAQVLAEVRTIPAGSISAFAQARLPMLDAPFVQAFDPRPVIAIAAATPVPPEVQRIAINAPATAPVARKIPWLRVDTAAFANDKVTY